MHPNTHTQLFPCTFTPGPGHVHSLAHTWPADSVNLVHAGGGEPEAGAALVGGVGRHIVEPVVQRQEELLHALVTDAVLARQDQRVREQLLARRANELPFDIPNGDLESGRGKHQRTLGGLQEHVCASCVSTCSPRPLQRIQEQATSHSRVPLNY